MIQNRIKILVFKGNTTKTICKVGSMVDCVSEDGPTNMELARSLRELADQLSPSKSDSIRNVQERLQKKGWVFIEEFVDHPTHPWTEERFKSPRTQFITYKSAIATADPMDFFLNEEARYLARADFLTMQPILVRDVMNKLQESYRQDQSQISVGVNVNVS